jgi:hypothetical protein
MWLGLASTKIGSVAPGAVSAVRRAQADVRSSGQGRNRGDGVHGQACQAESGSVAVHFR